MATTFEQSGSILTIKPEGRIDTKTSPILESDIQKYIDSTDNMILDFTNVDYISSAGMRVLLALHKKLNKKGGTLKVINVKDAIYDIFKLVGFHSMVEVSQG